MTKAKALKGGWYFREPYRHVLGHREIGAFKYIRGGESIVYVFGTGVTNKEATERLLSQIKTLKSGVAR